MPEVAESTFFKESDVEIPKLPRGIVQVEPRVSHLAEALAKAQSEFTPVVKDKTATIRSDKGNYSYKFSDLADVLKMALPVLSKNGLAITQPLLRKEGKLYVTTRLLHSSGETLEDDGIFIPENIQPQQFGIYLSYFRRYSASSILGVAPDEDTDGVISEPEKAPPAPPRGRPAKKEEPVQKTDVSVSSGQVQKADKRTEFAFGANEAAPRPEVLNASPAPPKEAFQANDDDVPEIIGTPILTQEETVEMVKKLKPYYPKFGEAEVKAFVYKTANVKDSKLVTRSRWATIFEGLEKAKDANDLK